jgi:hypothetical protein
MLETKKKFSKAEVKFEHPGMGKDKCGECAFFLPKYKAGGRGACQIVEGEIYATDWCNQFKRQKVEGE